MKLLIGILASYFAIGAVLILVINRKRTLAERSQSWIKYGMYLGIVFITLFCAWIHPLAFQVLAAGIALAGFLELLKVLKNNTVQFRVSVLSTYLCIATGFVFFAFSDQNQIIYTYFLILVFDGFSQLSGQLLGKTKLVEKVSPNKTVEGLAGGLFVALISAISLHEFMNLLIFESIFSGLLIVFSALAGDLLASWVKRKCAVKDYSELIPGHGGILDRFDSFIFAGFIQTVSLLILLVYSNLV